MSRVMVKNLGDIKGYEFYSNYIVTSEGRVFNTKTGREVGSKKEYMQVSLSAKLEDGSRVNKTCYIHQIVAAAWLDEVEDKTFIDHVNRDKFDNRLENLRYVNREENLKNSERKPRKSTKNTPVVAINTKTRETFSFASLAEACRQLQINYSVAMSVLKGKKKSTKDGFKFIAI
ncbi:HNH endonuclease signature motif containing protein [Romboutsia sp. 1001216sp1]|uniref:HNH endonuclease signature motif containing protein n=1 Tax=Romboutsia sp. 1001216sp1 TaxID=2986997 RepID=UPI00232D398E|nr:HNH endonuclease signature motif containing protein [Romboutsia sp. 1001216sp1]MDB8790527.1 HNH endonuclease signature motif containing protein [Romboutsia sp. 1001216sp1]